MTTGASRYLSPNKVCDLVMKGGITSGIVYPPAVLELAREYRFICIGGASAGAIAASVTAAAEYGRNSGGFEKLEGVNHWLGKGTNLFNLFQPAPRTRPLLEAFLEVNHSHASANVESRSRPKSRLPWWRAFLGFAPRATRRALPAAYWLIFAFGLLAGTLLGAVFVRGLLPRLPWFHVVPLSLGFAFVGIPLAWISALFGTLAMLGGILVRDVPKNGYGVCTGHRDDSGPADPPALTDWLHEQIQKLAGRKPDAAPLTIGDLSQPPHRMQVRMVTTNLSLCEPFIVPFDELYFFQEDELGKYFPKAIIEFLKQHPRPMKRVLLDEHAFRGYHAMPRAEDVPLVVAARMSLSFPVLLSAVPLYSMKRSALAQRRDKATGLVTLASPKDDLERHWFSDGGISSNFPIHFFDSWFPTRPTFGINLTSFPENSFEKGPAQHSSAAETLQRLRPDCQTSPTEEDDDSGISAAAEHASPRGPHPSDPGDAVYLPGPSAPQYPVITPIHGLFGFLNAIWATAQNYRDNMQSRLPSYRERIVQVRFAPEEGGLNLAMGEKAIASIVAKGIRAGEILRDDFSLTDHRWVRLRVLLAGLETHIREGREAFPHRDSFRQFMLDLQANAPYHEDEAWRNVACEYLDALADLVARWETIHGKWSAGDGSRADLPFFVDGAPKPSGALRVTPRV